MKQTFYSLDLIRILAATLVIIVHTKGVFFDKQLNPEIFAFFWVIGTIGVPLFVILTGYLMLPRNFDKDDYLSRYLHRNFLPLLISFECWNLLWFLFDKIPFFTLYKNPMGIKWATTVKAAFFIGDTNSALWYLPMTIALYLGIPIVSYVLKEISNKAYITVLSIALIISGTIIPTTALIAQVFGYYPHIHSVLKMNVFGASVWGESVWMIYVIAGYIIYKGKLRNLGTWKLLFFGIFIPLLPFYFIQLRNIYGLGPDIHSYDLIFVVIPSISLFEILNRIEPFFEKASLSFKKCLTYVSQASFTIYMLHIFVGGALIHIIQIIKPLQGFLDMVGYLRRWNIIIYFIFIIGIIIISCLIESILSKNKMIKRWLLLKK